MRPCRAGSEPDWRTRGSRKPEVADQLSGAREAPGVTDRGQQRAGGDEVDAGQGQQPAQLQRSKHELGERPIDRHHFGVEEVDSAQAGLDHLPLVDGQLLGGQPAPTGDAEEVGSWRASLQIADQDRVHLVLLACPLPHQLRAAGDPPAQHTRPFVRRPHLGQKASREQLRQRARIALVGLRRLRRVLDRLRVREHNATDMSLDDPGDRERVAGRLEHHLIIPGETLREQLERRRRRLDPARTTHPTTLGDCDFAEITVHIQRDEAHANLLSLNQSMETRQAKRQLRIRARGTPGQSQGRPTTNDGLAAHSVSDGLPNIVSP